MQAGHFCIDAVLKPENTQGTRSSGQFLVKREAGRANNVRARFTRNCSFTATLLEIFLCLMISRQIEIQPQRVQKIPSLFAYLFLHLFVPFVLHLQAGSTRGTRQGPRNKRPDIDKDKTKMKTKAQTQTQTRRKEEEGNTHIREGKRKDIGDYLVLFLWVHNFRHKI